MKKWILSILVVIFLLIIGIILKVLFLGNIEPGFPWNVIIIILFFEFCYIIGKKVFKHYKKKEKSKYTS